MIGPRSFSGIAIATATFLPLDKIVRIALQVTTGRAARWHQTLDGLAVDLLQDLFSLVLLGVILLPLWILDFFLLRALLHAGKGSWWLGALSGLGIGWIWGLFPCGFHIFRE